jgi:REase_DpnII-MboI
MKTRELIQKIQKFHDDLETHYYLWGQSLHPSLPEYPLKNVEELRKQTNNLARQLGALRPYIDQLSPSTILRAAGQEWDAYDSAASNDVAVRKGASISAVLPQLQQILGRLEAMDLESEFSLLSATEQQSVIAQANATSLSMAKFICAKFHVAAKQLEDRYENRPTLRIKDEYDVQDLLHVLLRVHFEDIRPEEWTPSYAGTSSRVDFLLKSEQIVIEAKITRPG